jgi:hypothetical protein
MPIQQVIRSILRERGLSSGSRHARVFRAWNEALGSPGRDRSEPVRFQAGELTVEVASSVHLQELKNFTGEDVRRRANEKLGTDAIRRVVFRLKS